MIKSTFKVLFYLRRDTVRKNGLMPIIARITIDGKLAQFSTKIEINPDLWSVSLGRASGYGRESQQANALMDDIKASLHRIYHEMQRRDSVVTAEKVKNEFLGITEHHDNLLDLFRKHNEDVQKLVGISKSAATYQKYEVTRKHMQAFIESKYKLSDISLKEINHMFITDFEVYLLTTGRCSQNTTAKFMQFFKRIITQVSDLEIKPLEHIFGVPLLLMLFMSIFLSASINSMSLRYSSMKRHCLLVTDLSALDLIEVC